jgi:hypothetical protein
MKAPPDRPGSTAAASRTDTLDDVDFQLDAAEERTDPVDPLRDAPTEVSRAEEPTDVLGPRELPTGPMEGRTAPWMKAAPWVNPEAPDGQKSDPWLWPVLVFVMVLLTCIVVFLYQEMHKHP